MFKFRLWRRAMAMALLPAIFLAGCAGGGKFEPQQSSLFISGEGAVTSATVRTYEVKDYYSEDALRALAEQYAAEYSEAVKNPGAVTLKECRMEKGTATVVYEYASGEDLARFASEYEDADNQVESLTVSALEELVGGEMSDDVVLTRLKDKSTVRLADLGKLTGYFAVAVDGAVRVQTEGKIQYVSRGVKTENAYTAVTPGEKSYIIFK